jgi:hypothetical protein
VLLGLVADASKAECEELLSVLTLEVRASRDLQDLLIGATGRRPFRMLHRRLLLDGK